MLSITMLKCNVDVQLYSLSLCRRTHVTLKINDVISPCINVEISPEL